MSNGCNLVWRDDETTNVNAGDLALSAPTKLTTPQYVCSHDANLVISISVLEIISHATNGCYLPHEIAAVGHPSDRAKPGPRLASPSDLCRASSDFLRRIVRLQESTGSALFITADLAQSGFKAQDSRHRNLFVSECSPGSQIASTSPRRSSLQCMFCESLEYGCCDFCRRCVPCVRELLWSNWKTTKNGQ
jgi:hypothetical protein